MRTSSTRIRGAILRAGVVLFAATLALAGSVSSTEAHPKHFRGGHRIVVSHPVPRTTFVIPHRIPVHRAHVFDPFFHGRVFFAPHRHFHVVYHFPVVTGFGIVYEPFTYCDGVLFAPPFGGFLSYSSPRVGVFVGF
jgi:hypothetical protein